MAEALVRNVGDLAKVLEKKFGSRIEIDPFSLLTKTEIRGVLDNKKFLITFIEDFCLLLSVEPNAESIIDYMKPTLKIVMDKQEPILRYALQEADKTEAESSPTIEWDIKDPESRIRDIVNERGFSRKTKIHNIVILNGKKIEDYMETPEERQRVLDNAKIYGIYPGSIKDVSKIEALSEVDLYFLIDALGGHIWNCRHQMSHGLIPPIDLTEEQYALEYLVYMTRKFGVELEEPEYQSHVSNTPSYRAWFQFYDDHFKSMTDEEWNEFKSLKDAGEDVSAYMPKGSWKDLLKKPEKKI